MLTESIRLEVWIVISVILKLILSIFLHKHMTYKLMFQRDFS